MIACASRVSPRGQTSLDDPTIDLSFPLKISCEDTLRKQEECRRHIRSSCDREALVSLRVSSF